MARELAFALAFLFFAVPFGEALIPVLMEFTAKFTVGALRLSGITVYRDGMLLSTVMGDFQVEKACSGIRYLIASLAVGSLFAFLMYRSPWRRAAFICLSIIVPIIGNGLRAYLIVLLALTSDMQAAVGIDHLIYGWLFFGLLMAGMFWVGLRFREPPEVAINREDLPSDSATSVPRGGPLRDIGIAIAAVLLMSCGPLWAGIAMRASGVPAGAPQLPAGSEAWSGPTTASLPWQHGFPAQTREQRGEYRDGAGNAVIVAAYSLDPQDGRGELVSSVARPIAAGGAVRVTRTHTIHTATGVALRQSEAATPLGRWLVWDGYAVAGHLVASEYAAKLRQAWSRLRGEGGAVAIIVLATRTDGTGRASAALEDFATRNLPQLLQCAAGQYVGGSECVAVSGNRSP